MQKSVCAVFGKDYPSTTVSFVLNEMVFEDFGAQPFGALSASPEARVLFSGKVLVSLRNMIGETAEIAVDSDVSLRELQALVCKLFHQRFPATKATLVVDHMVYDDFMHIPFKTCTGSVEATVTFAPTDDPYFYDLRDRRSGKRAVSDISLEPWYLH